MRANGIELAYERSGPASGQPLLLIHGVGAQLIQWPPEIHEALAAAGYSVIRFDNRDVGLSTHCSDSGVPDIAAALEAHARGETPDIPYRVADMAADTIGLLDALGVDRVHVVGASLGGAIAQTLAIAHPNRVASLTILMSWTGNPATPPNNPAVLMTPLPDPATDEDGYVRGSIGVLRAIGSPGYPIAEDRLDRFARDAVRRAYDPAGAARQLAAGRTSPDLRDGLGGLSMPTLVIHGTDDPLIPFASGEDVARNIPGAFLLAIRGMGHDLPPSLCPALVDAILMNARRARG